jgi:putative peptide zinc metalloprotease protein
MTSSRRLALILTTILVALGLGAGAPAQARAQDNAAVAVNLKDGAELLRFAFKVVRANQEVVDQSNAAVAYASCEECRTIAVALQVVLVVSDPEIVTPENVALAVNYECTACETLASAYQFVYSVPEGFHFSAEAKREIARIRNALRELIRSGRPVDEMQAEIDALADDLRAIIRHEIDTFDQRARDRDEVEQRATDVGEEGVDASTEETPTDTVTTTTTTETTPTEPTGTETATTP